MRLLVVEDHPTLGGDLKIYLESRSYAVDLLTTGEEAQLQGLDIPYDLIILDIMLPDISGLEVCRFLREHQQQVPFREVRQPSHLLRPAWALAVFAR